MNLAEKRFSWQDVIALFITVVILTAAASYYVTRHMIDLRVDCYQERVLCDDEGS